MKGSKSEMDRVCELCEQERASVVCSADAVMLCETCDADIHPVNTRLSHHVRIPLSFSLNHHTTESDCPLPGRGDSNGMDEMEIATCFMQNPRASPASNPRFNPSPSPNPNPNRNFIIYEGHGELVPELLSADCMFFHMDEYLDMEYIDSMDQVHMDLSIRDPSEATIAADANNAEGCNGAKTMMKLSSQGMTSSSQMMTDREVRVLRYKEKKKNRKFEKKIRYTSRKVYADTRPRIKGRFVKIIGAETEREEQDTREKITLD
ncbi:hypothetical protein LUZ60_008860 [Juncus effusus]|nr:hypothetical protein LUZ60_008860 [Juncus effusus]